MPAPKVLIADDDAKFLGMLKLQLKAAGYDVATAQDSYLALQSARRSTPDIILLDVNMPAGDGFSVRGRLQRIATTARIPVIFLTGEQSARIRKHSREFGASAVVHKPFELEELLAEMEDALGVSCAP